MRGLLPVLAASVIAATSAEASQIGDVFFEACLAPLVEGTPIGDLSSLGPEENVAPNGSYTGRQWQTDEGFLLSEMNSGLLNACDISLGGAQALDDVAHGTPEQASLLWSEFSEVAKKLIAGGRFQERSTDRVENARIFAIETIGPNPNGRIVAAFVYHDQSSNYAFIAAAEAEVTSQ